MSDEQNERRQLITRIAYFKGYIVTANEDDSIPLNAKCLFEVQQSWNTEVHDTCIWLCEEFNRLKRLEEGSK